MSSVCYFCRHPASHSTGIRSPVYIYAAMDRAPTTKAERVRHEKEGLHGYETTPVYPSIPLSSGTATSPVSGLVHEDDVPRDEPSIPSSSGRAPSPVSGLVHEDGPRDEAASGLRHPFLYSVHGIRFFLSGKLRYTVSVSSYNLFPLAG